MDAKLWSGREVQQVGPRGVRRWKATLVGKEVRTKTSAGAGAPRAAVRAHATAEAAASELVKALRKKMLDDHVFLRPEAEVGELMFAMALPGGGPADNFDVTPDGETLLVGAGRGDPKALVVRVSLRTGAIERFDVPPDRGRSQLFVHGALVERDGAAAIVGVNEVVRRLNFKTGTWRQVASVMHRGQEHVNPFCVEPQRDAAHRRILLVSGDRLEVRELATGAALLTTPIGTRTAECRRIALSPSGELAAAHVISRHLVYGHEDAAKDTTDEVQVWRVADGARIAAIPAGTGGQEPASLAVTPDDRALLLDAGRALVCVDLASLVRTRVLAESSGAVWNWTPAGELAVFDGVTLNRRSAPQFRARGAMTLEAQRGQRLRCVPGLAIVGGAGLFCVYRMKW